MTTVTGYRFQCSPMGRLSGFHVASGPAGTVELLVLPKVWADDPTIRWSANAVRWDADQDTVRLVVPEVRTITVFTDSDDRLALLASIGVDSTRRQQLRRPAATGDTPPPPAVGDPDEGTDDGNDTGPLVTTTPVTRAAPATDPTEGASASADAVAGGLGALATLGIATDLLDLPPTDLLPDRFSRVGRALRPVVHRRFVDEVGRQLRWSRRGYRSRTETLGVVRGRIHDTSVMRQRATGLPELTCSFDEFNRQTPLLTLVATALDEVASRPDAPRTAFVRSTVHRAVALRRHLADVASIPPPDAVRSGLDLRLDRLTRRWEGARLLALACLAQRVDALDRQHHASEVAHLELGVNTARAWERILLQALDGVSGWTATNGNALGGTDPSGGDGWSVPSPWEHLGAARSPDILLKADRARDPLVIVDAKYKVGQTGASTPDANQMFVYSHLATHRSGVGQPARGAEVVAIAYPAATGATAVSPRHRRQGPTGGEVTLEHWGVPYPPLTPTAEGDLDLTGTRAALDGFLAATSALQGDDSPP